MKKLLLAITVTLLLANCQSGTSQEVNPETVKFDGKWQLVKIGVGFPPPNGPTSFKPPYQEVLEFNISKRQFTRTKDGKITENNSFKITDLAEFGGSTRRAAIVFEEDNTYAFYSFIENPNYLTLQQRVPIGAYLADGNTFFYEKMQ